MGKKFPTMCWPAPILLTRSIFYSNYRIHLLEDSCMKKFVWRMKFFISSHLKETITAVSSLFLFKFVHVDNIPSCDKSR